MPKMRPGSISAVARHREKTRMKVDILEHGLFFCLVHSATIVQKVIGFLLPAPCRLT
jgi:hypothetical protein